MEQTITEIDRIIGERIKIYRKNSGLTQSDLARKMDLTFQQIQKYEKGKSSITIKRLMQVSSALHVPLRHLIFGSDDLIVSSPATGYGDDIMDAAKASAGVEESEMLSFFRRINNPRIRQGIIRQIEGLWELENNKGNT